MKKILLVLLGAVALLVPAAAAHAVPVGVAGGPTLVREHAGTIAYSERDAAGAWHLTVRQNGRPPVRLNTSPGSMPFQADIGTDTNGLPAAVYQRCAGGTASRPTGCDLFIYRLTGDGGEHPIRNANSPSENDTMPTLWRGRLAWAREYASGPIVYTKTLTAPRSRRSTRLPGVPQRRCGDVDPGCGPTRDRAVDELELRGVSLAMTVRYSCEGCAGILKRELRLVDLDDRSASQIAVQTMGLSGQSLVGPSFTPRGKLGWYKACLGDPAACQGGNAMPFRYTPSTRRYERGAAGPIRVEGYADAGNRIYEVVGCEEQPEPSAADADCRVEELPAPAFTRTTRPRG